MFGPPPARLPPLREVNHTIPLINPDAVYSTRTPRCSSALFPLLREKTERYVKSGWWEPAHGRNAIPILCIPKISKELKLRTVIDARERNANTVIDSTPLPSQDTRSGSIASVRVYHRHIRRIRAVTRRTGRCAKNHLRIPTGDLRQQYPPTRGLQWAFVLAKVHDVRVSRTNWCRGMGIPRRYLYFHEDPRAARKCS